MSESSTPSDIGHSHGLPTDLGSLFYLGGVELSHLRVDVRPDAELTRCVVPRRMRLVGDNYPLWPDFVRRVALGVLMISTTRDINMQEIVHFTHLPQGGAHRRSHGGKTFLYDNGAFRLFNGVMPASVLQRCR